MQSIENLWRVYLTYFYCMIWEEKTMALMVVGDTAELTIKMHLLPYYFSPFDYNWSNWRYYRYLVYWFSQGGVNPIRILNQNFKVLNSLILNLFLHYFKFKIFEFVIGLKFQIFVLKILSWCFVNSILYCLLKNAFHFHSPHGWHTFSE